LNTAVEEFLKPAPLVDSDHPEILRFAHEAAGDARDPQQKAVQLYYAVRDRFRYDPYALDISDDGLRASSVLRVGHGWCVTKSALLAAACRALGVPAKVGYADVRNHLSTERMRQTMKTDIFYWHGYTSIHLDGQWLKATPAFNIELCRRFALQPLEFDGTADSIYHPYDLSGNRHMEYLQLRGEMFDVPAAAIRADFALHYPLLGKMSQASFEQDVKRETSAAGT